MTDSVPIAPRSIASASASAAAQPATWRRRYTLALLCSDIAAVTAAVLLSQVLRFGTDTDDQSVVEYTFVSVLIVVAWVISLGLFDSRDERVIGAGSNEYKRVFNASFAMFGVVAITSLMSGYDLARGYLAIAFPAGVLFLFLARWLCRNYLVQQRVKGKCLVPTVVVGSVDSSRYLVEKLQRNRSSGYLPIGVVLAGPTRGIDRSIFGLPIVGTIADVGGAAQAVGAEKVMLTSSEYLPPDVVRSIGWSLEKTTLRLAIAPSATEIAGPRIHSRLVEGLPLLSVDVPRFEGTRHAVKTVFDGFIAALAIIVALPVFLVIAALILIEGDGPVFFRQERVGRDGVPFHMLKFRTMVVNAEELKQQLLEQTDRDGLMFKMRDDPRVTRVGRVLRRFSLDELPQLINVLRGEMAMVGPRPPLVSEVEQYETDVRRRLLVKPGITGPWQISGRADLSWDEGVRLDLYYVENWSLAGDLVLLFRTAGAVLRGSGAY